MNTEEKAMLTELRQALVDTLSKHNHMFHFDDDPKEFFTQEFAKRVKKVVEGLYDDELFDLSLKK